MSQNQSYFWQTTRHNVYLKRTAKWHMLIALMAVLTFATVCAEELQPKMNDDNRMVLGAPTNLDGDANGNEIDNNGAAGGITEKLPEVAPPTESTSKSKAGFVDAFTASISVILLTELGDKTFFIAAIMAMRHPRLIVFSGAIFALALMTVLSVVFGMAATIIPQIYTYYISTALFAIFGIKMLYEGYRMKDTDAQEELEEVQSDLRKREDELLRKSNRKYSYDDNDIKRKNSNSDKDDDGEEYSGAGAEQSLIQRTPGGGSISIRSDMGAGATVVANSMTNNITNHLNNNNTCMNNNNNEMQHRQRKQNRNTPNVNTNLKKLNSCDKIDYDGDDNNTTTNTEAGYHHHARDSEVFLDKNGIAQLKMSSYHSSPALSQQTHATNCDSPMKSINSTTSICTSSTSKQDTHPAAAAALIHKPSHGNGFGAPIVLAETINGSLNSIIEVHNDHDATVDDTVAAAVAVTATIVEAAGQPNGELKQRLDRDVNAALVKDPESGVVRKNTKKGAAYLSTRIFVQAFTMTFLAEWGDRSQITTIILGASKNVFGVIAGGILGHSICTGLAVIGGRIVAAKISVRTVTIVGGIVFIGFAVYSLLMPPDNL